MNETPLPVGTVTFLFSDIERSSELLRLLGDDAFARIRAEHRRLLRDAFAANGGREIDTSGDGFFVAFDSARSAVSAAVTAQHLVAEAPWPAGGEVRIRIGLHTAEPHLAEDGYVGIGVHRAARICDAARGGQILVSNATAGIVEDADLEEVALVDVGIHRLKGLPREQRLFQVMAAGTTERFDRPRGTESSGPSVGTFLLTDLSGHRLLIRRLGDEASGNLVAEYQATVCDLVEAGRGAVLERVADTVIAVFVNASDAVRTAAAILGAVADSPWPPDCEVTVSSVVHSGRWSGDPTRPAAGTAFMRLTHLAQVVEPGQVLVSSTTAALLEGDHSIPPLRDLGERAVPEAGEPWRVYELTVERSLPT